MKPTLIFITFLLAASNAFASDDILDMEMVKLVHKHMINNNGQHTYINGRYNAGSPFNALAIDGSETVVEISSDKLDMPPTLEQLAAMNGEK